MMKDTIPQSTHAAHEHLARLREREKGTTLDEIKDEIKGSINGPELIEDLEALEEERDRSREQTLERSGMVSRVVQELLQNAHDIPGCGAVVFTLTPDELIVENDGRVMTEKNVDRLCSFNRTTKSGADSIGQFGTGFKTIFSITDNPRIDSGHYHFEFHLEAPSVPQTRSDTAPTEETTIKLPFGEHTPEGARKSIKRQLTDLSEYLKYLSQLETVQVRLVNSQGEAELINYYRGNKDSKQFVLKERDDKRVETNMRKDFTKPVIIDGKEKEITLSVPVCPDGFPEPSERDSKLYCHFPTQDIIPVPFDIQADFQVPEDRQHILPDSEKNNRMLDAVADCVREARDHYLHERSEPTAFLSLLPDPKKSVPTSLPDEQSRILQRIKQGTLNVFQESNCIECECDDCSLHRPAEIFYLDNKFKNLFSATDYKQLFGEKRYQPVSEYSSTISDRVRELSDVHDIEVNKLFNACRETDFIEPKSKKWLVKFCTAAAAYRESKTGDMSEFDASLAALPVLWLTDSLIAPKNSGDEPVYFPLTKSWNLSGASDIVDELNVLDRTFYTQLDEAANEYNSNPKQLFKVVFDVKELKPKTLIKRVIPRLQSPSEDSEAKHDQAIRLLYEYYCRHGLLNLKQDFSELNLRTQTGEYKSAKELLFSDIYREEPDYRLDPLAEKLPSVYQISENYAQLTSNEDAHTWNSFLSELGVQTHLLISPEKKGYRDRESLREAIQEGKRHKRYSFTMPGHLQNDSVESVLPPDEAVRTKGYNGQDGYKWMKRRKQGQGHKYGLVDSKLDTGNLETLLASQKRPNVDGIRKNLLKMVSVNWDEYYSDFAYIKCAWAVEGGQYSAQDVETASTKCPTTFIQMLRTVESIPCRDGSYRLPEEVYISTTETENTQVPLLDLHLNKGFRDCLGVRTELGPEHLAYALKQLAQDWEAGEIDDVDRFLDKLEHIGTKLSSVMEENGEEVREILTTIEYPVPNQPGEVRPFERLVWQGNNLNDWLLTVRDAYGTNFQSLMINQLDVSKTATINQAINNYNQSIKFYDEGEKQFEHVETAFVHLIEICVKRGVNDLATDLGEKIDTLPALDNKLAPVEDISYYCSNKMAVAQAPVAVKQRVLSVSPSNVDAAAVTEVRKLYNETFGLRTLASAWTKSVDEYDHTEDNHDTAEYYTQMLNLLYSVLGEHTGYDAPPIEKLCILATEKPRWANQLTCTHQLDDTVISKAVEADCTVEIDSHSEPVVTLTTDVKSVASMTTEFLTQLSIDIEIYSEVINVVDNAFGKPDGLIKQYLEKRGYSFQEIPETPPDERTSGEASSSGSGTTTDEIEQIRENEPSENEPSEGETNGDKTDPTDREEAQISEARDPTDDTEITPREEDDISGDDSEQKPDRWNWNENAKENQDRGSQNRQTDNDEIGKVAEAYTVWRLAREVKSHFESHGSYIETKWRQETAKEEDVIVRGSIRDEEYTIQIENVGLKRRGYDIHISGAVLSDTSLAVSKIETGAVSTVEIKGSKSDTHTRFTMTKNEKKYGETTTDQYYVVRLRSVDPETKWPTDSTAEVDRVWKGFDELKSDTRIMPLSYEIAYSKDK